MSIPPSAYGPAASTALLDARAVVERAVVQGPRCWRCGKLLAEFLTVPFSIQCYRCKAANRVLPSGSTYVDLGTPSTGATLAQ